MTYSGFEPGRGNVSFIASRVLQQIRLRTER